MQAVGPAPAFHQTSGKLIDDDDLSILDDIMLIPVEQNIRAQRGIQMMNQNDVGRIIQGSPLGQQTHAGQYFFRFLVTGIRKIDLIGFFILGVITGNLDFSLAVPRFLADLQCQHFRYGIHLVVKLGIVFRLPRNNQRRSGLIDQNRIHLIDNGINQPALDTIRHIVNHIVAQIVETEFVIGSVCNVSGIGSLLLAMIHRRQIDSCRQTKPAIQTGHPFRITLGQIIVNRDNMDTFSGQAIQVGWQCRHQCFSFTGCHFGNLAIMKRHPSDQLDIVRSHPQNPLACFPANGKCLGQDIIQRFPAGKPFLEFRGFCFQFGIRHFLQSRFERIDFGYGFTVLLQQPGIAAAEKAGQYRHVTFLKLGSIIDCICIDPEHTRVHLVKTHFNMPSFRQ